MYRGILKDNSRSSAIRSYLQMNGVQTLKELEEISVIMQAHDEQSFIYLLQLPGDNDEDNCEWLKSIQDVKETTHHAFICTKEEESSLAHCIGEITKELLVEFPMIHRSRLRKRKFECLKTVEEADEMATAELPKADDKVDPSNKSLDLPRGSEVKLVPQSKKIDKTDDESTKKASIEINCGKGWKIWRNLRSILTPRKK